jgi:hypothetical protein
VCRPRDPLGDALAPLKTFFSEQLIADFAVQLGGAVADFGPNGEIDLNLVSDPEALVAAFAGLLDGANAASGPLRPTKFRTQFDFDPRTRFLQSPWGAIHQEMFRLDERYRGAWVQGKSDYAVRVAMRGRSSGREPRAQPWRRQIAVTAFAGGRSVGTV